MAINKKSVIGVVTTVTILGVTVYVIKKYYDSKKQEDQSISLEEAKQIVEEGASDPLQQNVIMGSGGELIYDPDLTTHKDIIKFRLSDQDTEMAVELIDEMKDDAREQANYNNSFNVQDVKEDSAADAYPKHSSYGPIGVKASELEDTLVTNEEAAESAWYETDDPQEVQDSKGYFEEDKDVIDELRYEPNSVEAREQYFNMELVVLGRDNDTRDIVSMLYDHEFVPMCDEDQNLKVRLIDHRIKFFGMTSKWNKQVTFGDVIMYYGKAAAYNCGDDVRHWVDYFLTCADLNNIILTSEEIEDKVRVLNTHNYFNEDLQSHGLFGLTSSQMTEAIVVSRNRIDARVTYDIEFNQFVQGVIMG